MSKGSKTFAANIATVPEMMKYVTGLFGVFTVQTAYDLTLVCEEILVNIASYAYPQEKGSLEIAWENDVENHTFSFSFTDSGISFNPLLQREPNLNTPIKERKIGGLGIMMIRKLTDEVQYHRANGKNILTITKKY